MENLTGERKIALKALVGSHNYNLNTEESDRDYKVFVVPTFDDLYEGSMFSNSVIGEEADYDVHDIRKLGGLFYKANLNFLEVLFSEDLEIPDDAGGSTKAIMRSLVREREDIARMNLPYLYNACIGMHHNKKRLIEKSTAGTMHLLEKHGYDTKQALHSYRVLDFLARYAENGFRDFKGAITYSSRTANGTSERDEMLKVKNGYYSLEEFREFLER